MRPTTMLAVVVLALVGCGKKPADGEGSGGLGGGPVVVSDGAAVTDWTRVGDVSLRVTKVVVQKPTLVVAGTKAEREGKESELLVRVEVVNASEGNKLTFRPWVAGDDKDGRPEVEVSDDKGNRYNVISNPLVETLKGNDYTLSGVISPGDPPFVWVFRFERPVNAATELRLSARPPVENPPPGRHELRIPAAAWKR